MLDSAHHDGSPLYVSSIAPRLGDRLELRLLTRRDHQPETVVLRTVVDGEPFTVVAEAKEGEGEIIWWTVSLEVVNPVTTYRWLLSGGAYAYTWVNASGLVDYDVPDADDFVVSAFPAPPAWESRAVVYQVFPDRFSRRSEDESSAELDGKYGLPLPEWAVPRPWTAHPEGRGPNTPREFFGGDLDGLRERLDYVAELGADVLYLTPIFPAGSSHRYDSTTFASIDPLLGGERALAELVRAAHERGIRVIGDLTLNHCGSSHEWFVRAKAGSEPERSFFIFDERLELGYAAWLGVPSLPKFDLTSPALREALVGGPASPVRTWVGGEDGFDGWRIDVANMAGRMGSIDVTHDLARQVRSVLAEERDDLLLVAEHAHDAAADLSGDGWHGTMNYAAFTRQVWCWLSSPGFDETFLGLPVELPTISGEQMVASMRAFHGRIPWRSLLASWNLLGSHDTARIRTVVGSAERQIAAFSLAVGLPGVPMLFAGDEIGATGSWGEDARTPFPWHDRSSWDAHTLEAYRALIRLRTSSPALAAGGLRWVHAATDSVAFLREHPEERLLVVVARSQCADLHLPLAFEAEHLFGFDAASSAGHLVVRLPAAGAGIWRLT